MLKLAMVTLWPSFIVAGLADGLFFSMFDPEELLHLLGREDLPGMAAYTVGFFCFWVFALLASVLTWYMARTDNYHEPRI